MGGFVRRRVVVDKEARKVFIGNEELDLHEDMTGDHVTSTHGKVYIDGFELKNGKWKRTFMALWYWAF